jgi:hypothetical protein
MQQNQTFDVLIQSQYAICVEKFLAMNESTTQFGLSLSLELAMELAEQRQQVLLSLGRVEMGVGIMTKLIEVFMGSPYLQQTEYIETLVTLYETFHYIKNEMSDDIGDEELMTWMVELYDGECHGDVNLLAGLYAERLIALYKNGNIDFDKDDFLIKEALDPDEIDEDSVWEE